MADDPSKLRRGATYPGEFYFGPKSRKRYRWNGEKRPPKAGEFYLSGADITAYRAPNDLDSAYHIAEEVPAEELKCPTCGCPKRGQQH